STPATTFEFSNGVKPRTRLVGRERLELHSARAEQVEALRRRHDARIRPAPERAPVEAGPDLLVADLDRQRVPVASPEVVVEDALGRSDRAVLAAPGQVERDVRSTSVVVVAEE